MEVLYDQEMIIVGEDKKKRTGPKRKRMGRKTENKRGRQDEMGGNYRRRQLQEMARTTLLEMVETA